LRSERHNVAERKAVAAKAKLAREKAVFYSIFYLLLILFFVLFYMAGLGMISIQSADLLLSAVLSLIFPFAAIAYLLHKGVFVGDALKGFGLGRSSLSLKMIGIGVVLFLVVFALELFITAFSEATGITINTNISLLLQGAPVWFYLFATFIGPIDEEIFFRGFLVPRIGIIWSALFFAVLHAGYNSSFGIEIIAAFIFGLLAGYIFKKTKSLYPSIAAHILVNALAVAAMAVL